MQTDYIIVGLGLAGLAITQELEKNDRSFVVFDDNSQTASIVAGGMYNPIVLKRFSPVWNGAKQLELALPMYKKLEKQFSKKYDYPTAIYRIFKSVEEQNKWFEVCDKPLLSNFMVPEIIHENYKGLIAEYGYGKLVNTGRIDTRELLNDYSNYLRRNDLIKEEKFIYRALEICEDNVKYKGISASKIVFCEGFGVKKNPFFNSLPIEGSKGELLTIYAPELQIDFLVKAAVFILPIGNNTYKVGATFNQKDKTSLPTEEAKKELIDKLNSFINVPYKVIGQVAGVRPTVKDRRPMIGKHPKYNNIAVLNGLGTRGVLIAPYVAKSLYNCLEKGIVPDKEIDINRFQDAFL